MNVWPDLNFLPTECETALVPNIPFLDLPPDEQQFGLAIWNYLRELRDASAAFTAALFLRDHCGAKLSVLHMPGELLFRSLWVDWREIASKQAVFSARNYRVNLEELKGHLGHVKSWRGKIDADQIKLAHNKCKARFPHVIDVRDSLAHPEEYPPAGLPLPKMPTPKQEMIPRPTKLENGITQVHPRMMVSHLEFVVGWEGKTLSCDVSWGAAEFIRENARTVFDAFQKLLPQPSPAPSPPA